MASRSWARAYDTIDFPGLPQDVEPSKRGDDALDDFSLLPLVFDNLEIGSISARFCPDKHGRLHITPTEHMPFLRFVNYILRILIKTWHYILQNFKNQKN